MTEKVADFAFGNRSAEKLETVHPQLRAVAYHVMTFQVFDFTILYGWRGELIQNKFYHSGKSTKLWPDSTHNTVDDQGNGLSDALDFAPWCLLPAGKMGIPWEDTHAFAVIGGMFIAAGAALGIRLRYGGDWDMDGITTDQILRDWGHIELLR